MEHLVNDLLGLINSELSPELIVFFISLIPVLELRGGMLAASILGVDWKIAMIICIIGNIIPVPFILFFIKKIFWLLRNTSFAHVIDRIERKALEKSKKIFKYRNLGLYFFVAIPFPGTGAWTGALVAALFNIRIKKAILSITLGVFTAAIIMAVLSYGVLGIII